MDHRNVSRGLGNQVTVEFNLLYRFHCAISRRDEKYTEDFMEEAFAEMQQAADAAKEAAKTPSKEGAKTPATAPTKGQSAPQLGKIDIKNLSIGQFGALAGQLKKEEAVPPWGVEFGLKHNPAQSFKRNTITGLFDDKQMIAQLKDSMDDPICACLPLLKYTNRLTRSQSQLRAPEHPAIPQERRDHGNTPSAKMVSRTRE